MKRLFYVFIALVLALILISPTVTAYSRSNTCETKRIDASNVGGDYDCDSEEWHFIINQLESSDQAPEKIYVSWENGESEEVLLSSVNQQTAHYYTSLNLDSPVVEAYTNIYADWSGNFVISHGPCVFEEPTETPEPPTETPVPPTETPIPPTETETPEDPTATPTETPADPTETVTETPVDPTATPTEPPEDPTATPTEPPEDPTPTLPSPGGGPPSSMTKGNRGVVITLISVISLLVIGLYSRYLIRERN